MAYSRMWKNLTSLAGSFAIVTLACQALAQGITFFPPENCQPGQLALPSWDGVHNTRCLALPSCPSQMLTFNGISFQCVTVPTCAAGDLLTFNGSNFTCTNAANAVTAAQAALAACTTTTQTDVQACPAGETGQIYNQVTTNSCTGEVTTTPVNNCMIVINIATQGMQCSPGSTVTGQFINGILNPCTAGAGSCQSYTCTASGLVAQ